MIVLSTHFDSPRALFCMSTLGSRFQRPTADRREPQR